MRGRLPEGAVGAAVLVARRIHRILTVPRPRRSYTASDFLSRLGSVILPRIPKGLKEKLVRIFYDVDFS